MKADPEKVVSTVILLFMAIFVVSLVIFYGWVFVEYGDKPITEVPAWVYWLMTPQR